MSRKRFIIPILLGILLGMTFIGSVAAQDVEVLVTPDEAEVDVGGSFKFEVFAFTTGANKVPVNIDDIQWSLSSDSLGSVTQDGFFIAGKYVGKVEVKVRVIIRGRIFEKVVVVVIGKIPVPFFKVEIVPSSAVVPVGKKKQFKVAVFTPNGKTVKPNHVRWEVKPDNLGKISQDGLFVAGDTVKQGKVVAIVDVDGLILKAKARVVVSPPASSAIAGNVVTDPDGLPIEEAVVKAFRIGAIQWVRRAKTDSDGNYLIEKLIPGDYILHTRAKGYIGEFYDNTRTYLEATVLRVAENDTLTSKNFALNEGGKITGTVVADEDSLPLPKAHVVAFLKLKPKIAFNTLTGDDGTYEIESIPKGTYVLRANAVGYKGEYYNDKQRLADAELLNVEEGQTLSDKNFGLATTSAILGVVTNSVDGSPIAKARIRVFIGPVFAVHHRIYKETRTNEKGEYIVQIRQGAYYVYASAPGFNGEFYDNVRRIKDATMVHVYPDSHTVGVNFDLVPRGTIAGKVTDQTSGEPIMGAVVEAFKENMNIDAANTVAGFRAKTDSLGEYLIENVPSGKYLVRANAAKYLPEFYNEKPTKQGATLVEVKDSTNVVDINFTLELGGNITGLVASEIDSIPIPGALVQIWGVDVRIHRRAYSHNNGKYRIAGLPTGKYIVQVVAHGYFSEYYNDVPRRRDATPVPVVAPAETDSIDFYLKKFVHKRGTIAGRVVSDVDGVPLEGAVVVAVSPKTRYPHITFTGPHGFYQLTDLPPGKYFVFAWAEGFIGEFFKDAYLFKHARPVFVRAGQLTAGIDFGLKQQFRQGVYAVSGKILSNSTNQPIEGILVQAKVDNEIELNAVTNANGEYVLSGLPAGAYKIVATGAGYADGYYGGTNESNAANVPVGNGQDAVDVNLSLEIDNVTDVESNDDLESVPESFDLFQNYPNPFNPETNIKYQLSEASSVTIKIFNIIGQQIRTLVDKEQPAGSYVVKWDGKDDFGKQVATGLYIFQIKAGNKFKAAKSMLLMK